MTDNAEKLEEGWYWVRHEGNDLWEEPAYVYPGLGKVSLRCGILAMSRLEIGPRIQPPQGDEG